ncbi:MAG: Nif3-like dinuclear metal center hexameric protein, partial [Fimbriimonadaceae bacterium]|nr:Nif3-like dinuclear metal center hexameric protein [Fimbriimonadaceae bacterium]
EVKQHDALDAVSANLAIMAAGHYETEQPGVVALAERLREALPTVTFDVFEPSVGTHGRAFHVG